MVHGANMKIKKLIFKESTFIINYTNQKMRGTRWRSWLSHCATSRKVAGSIPDGVTGIFYITLPVALWPWG